MDIQTKYNGLKPNGMIYIYRCPLTHIHKITEGEWGTRSGVETSREKKNSKSSGKRDVFSIKFTVAFSKS